MNEEYTLVKELENLYLDYQYLKQAKHFLVPDEFAVSQVYMSLKELNSLLQDPLNINTQLKNILTQLLKEEEYYLSTLENRQKIHQRILNIKQPYKNILYFRYVCDKTFDEIADLMNYSTKRIYQLHKEAIQVYCKTYK